MMRPFKMKAAEDFLPGGQRSLTSVGWKRDYNLPRLYGGATSTLRSAAETAKVDYFGPNIPANSTRDPLTIWSRTIISARQIPHG